VHCDNAFGGGGEVPVGCSGLFAGLFKLLAQNSSECLLKRFRLVRHVLAQRLVDQGLVVATAGSMDLLAEPLDYFVIETNRDPGLAFGDPDDGAALAFAKVVV
jgi:hypothetical protein